jgi:hypothetical protein
VSSLADRFTAAMLHDPDRGREALRSLQERAARDPYLQTTPPSPLLTRPAFLTSEQRDGIERDLAGLVDLLLELPERLFDGDVGHMCASTGLDADQRAAVEATWRDREVVLTRADLLLDREGFKAIEINIHSCIGGIDSGPWHDAFAGLPVFREFIAAEGLEYVDPMVGVAATLRAAAERRGLGPRPTVAVVDWPTTYPIFAERLQRTSRLLEAHGFSAFACHAGELGLRDGQLVRGDRPIDILYRTFLLADVPEAPALLEPILAAHRSGRLLLAMSFAAELVGNKASLALLSDSVERGLFSPHEQALVRRTVPWTRLLRRGATLWRGRRVDMRELALREQNRLVLKPAGGYAGRGVLLGSTVSPRAWQAAIDEAIGGFWVLQERVRSVAELVPRIEDSGRLGFEEVDINWGVFLMDGRYGGTMLRAVPRARGGVISGEHDAAVGGCFCVALDR